MAISTSDLVSYQDRVWTVTKVDPYLRVAVLYSHTGSKAEAPLEDVLVVASPSTDWYLLLTPIRPKAGRIVDLKIPSLRGQASYLIPWFDWVPSDPMRAGGSVYLREKHRPGTTILVTYGDGTQSKVVVKKLSTVAEIREKAEPKQQETLESKYDRLLRDE